MLPPGAKQLFDRLENNRIANLKRSGNPVGVGDHSADRYGVWVGAYGVGGFSSLVTGRAASPMGRPIMFDAVFAHAES